MKGEAPWFLDSGCSTHMTRNRGKFISFREHEGGKITFGDGSKANIEGKGTVELNTGLILSEVSYAKNLDT